MKRNTILLLAVGAALILLGYCAGVATQTTHSEQTQSDAQFSQKEQVLIGYAVQSLINCESQGRNVKIIDSNGYYSYGILQFQKSTWQDFEQKSGISGDPMVPEEAIKMAKWAIVNGYANRWTCWKYVPTAMQQQLRSYSASITIAAQAK